jgi:hypothetical protein
MARPLAADLTPPIQDTGSVPVARRDAPRSSTVVDAADWPRSWWMRFMSRSRNDVAILGRACEHRDLRQGRADAQPHAGATSAHRGPDGDVHQIRSDRCPSAQCRSRLRSRC